MKNKIMRFAFYYVLLLIPLTDLYAQGQYKYTSNPEYLYSPFTDGSSCTGPSSMWLHSGASCLEGWGPSHGSPDMINNLGGAGSPDYVLMAGAHYVTVQAVYGASWWPQPTGLSNCYSEGLFHPFSFTSGSSYNIKVGIRRLDRVLVNDFDIHPDDSNQVQGENVSIQIYAIKNIPTYKTQAMFHSYENPAYSNAYNNPPPTIYTKQLIGEYKVTSNSKETTAPTGDFPTGGYLDNMQWTFTTAAINAAGYDEIMIAVHDYDNPTNTWARLYIDYIEVCTNSSVAGSVIYDASTVSALTTPVPYTIQQPITVAGTITAGDPSVTSPGIAVPQTSNTEFHAYSTLLEHNFYAYTTENDFFLVEPIRECSSSGYPEPSGLSKPGRGSFGNRQIQRSGVSFAPAQPLAEIQNTSSMRIYPNPTTGIINIEMSQKGNYVVRIMSMVGTVIYEGEMNDEQKKLIQLDNKLPAGNYLIQVTSNATTLREKLMIVK